MDRISAESLVHYNEVHDIFSLFTSTFADNWILSTVQGACSAQKSEASPVSSRKAQTAALTALTTPLLRISGGSPTDFEPKTP